MGKYGTFEMGMDMPGDYWAREFSDRGLAGDLFTLLGAGLTKVSDTNRETAEKAADRKVRWDMHQGDLDARYAQMDADAINLEKRLSSEEKIADWRVKDDEAEVWWDRDEGRILTDDEAGGIFSEIQRASERPVPPAMPTDLAQFYPGGSGTMADTNVMYKQPGVQDLPAAGNAKSKRRSPVRIRRKDIPTMSAQVERRDENAIRHAERVEDRDLAQQRIDATDRRWGERMDSERLNREAADRRQRDMMDHQARQQQLRMDAMAMRQ